MVTRIAQSSIFPKAPLPVNRLRHFWHGLTEPQLSAELWASLRYFAYYRVLLSFCLCAATVWGYFSADSSAELHARLQLAIGGVWFTAALASIFGLVQHKVRFNLHLGLMVLGDVVALTLLMHLGGGVRSGLGVLMLVTLAGAGLVGQGRMVVAYAALATIFVLGEQAFSSLFGTTSWSEIPSAGIYSIGFFGVAITARLLAARVIANETLAKQRGEDLRNQTLIAQKIIEEMLDGVLVLDRSGVIRQRNPRAGALLGLGDPSGKLLSAYSTELAQSFEAWCQAPTGDPIPVRAPASGSLLRARFIPTDSTRSDVIVLLEDMGRIQEQARQLKLAALGRLTAGIAHEVRNPLSAISHAGELLQEELPSDHIIGQRLLKMVLDNSLRVERIVSDVLELGRRDRVKPELINLRHAVGAFVEEFILKEGISAQIVSVSFSGNGLMVFDRSHLHQILWNLLGNALRYASRQPGAVTVEVKDSTDAGLVEIHVKDDGVGVGEEQREKIFEPFFTTYHKGSGLGLYIARELCEANHARIDLEPSETGAEFCIYGRMGFGG